ncbi:MAG: metallophosphoesterase [Nanoarchaeota archaeon]|nr:metallophosphoesterase [Nanoarchaeota archaeon]
MKRLQFVTNEPAVVVGKYLVIADLHLGIEAALLASGVRLPSGTDQLLEKIEKLTKKAERLLILGDVKHEVPGTSQQEWRELPPFFRKLASIVPVDIVPGNHDTVLERIVRNVPNVTIHDAGGFRDGEFFFMHGHKWPSEDVVNAEMLLCGHVHPHIEFHDDAGKIWREPAWVAAPVVKKRLMEQYKTTTVAAGEQTLLLVPAFSDLAGSGVVNLPQLPADHRSPMLKLTRFGDARAFLLDGTDLGTINDLLLERPDVS